MSEQCPSPARQETEPVVEPMRRKLKGHAKAVLFGDVVAVALAITLPLAMNAKDNKTIDHRLAVHPERYTQKATCPDCDVELDEIVTGSRDAAYEEVHDFGAYGAAIGLPLFAAGLASYVTFLNPGCNPFKEEEGAGEEPAAAEN